MPPWPTHIGYDAGVTLHTTGFMTHRHCDKAVCVYIRFPDVCMQAVGVIAVRGG